MSAIQTIRRLLDRRLVLLDSGLPTGIALGRARVEPRRVAPFPLGALSDPRRGALLYSGTAALYQGLRALGIGRGARVLLPAYNCGHEVEPVLRTGASPMFYRVDSEMQIDVGDLCARLRARPAAVLVTHYFGFPQRIDLVREHCNEVGAALIEDCAHAFLSGGTSGPLGSLGDVAVFSLRKTLPIPDGGALVFRRTDLSLAGPTTAPPLHGVLGKSLDLWQKHMVRGGGLGAVARRRAALIMATPLLVARRLLPRISRAGAWYDPDDEALDFAPEILDREMSATSRRLLARFDFSVIRARRRANYTSLRASLEPLGEAAFPLGRALPDGVCPLYLPVRLERRDSVVEGLFERGVSAEAWWSCFHPNVPWGEFPEADALKREVIALPIHPDLERHDLARVAEGVLELEAGMNPSR